MPAFRQLRKDTFMLSNKKITSQTTWAGSSGLLWDKGLLKLISHITGGSNILYYLCVVLHIYMFSQPIKHWKCWAWDEPAQRREQCSQIVSFPQTSSTLYIEMTRSATSSPCSQQTHLLISNHCRVMALLLCCQQAIKSRWSRFVKRMLVKFKGEQKKKTDSAELSRSHIHICRLCKYFF